MKKLYMLSLTALLMAACAEEVTEKGNNGDFITFNVTENNLLPEPTVSTAAAEVPSFFNQTTPQTTVTAPIVSTPEPVKVKTNIELDEPLYMTTTIEKGIQMSNNHNTMRGSLIDENQTIKTITFGVTEFPAGSNTAVTGFNNPKSFSATSNESTAQSVSTGLTWESNATTQGYDFYAYAPYLSSSNYGLSLTDNNKSISYNSKAAGLTIANQQDLMTAVAENVNYTTSGVNLTFNHRLTAVKIVLSDTWSTYNITSVKFSSIYYKGKVAIQTGEWTLTDSDKGEYEITGTFNTANKEIAAYLMMIPQTLSTDMIITFKDGNNQTITFEVPLTTTWSPGATVTYTIGAQGITTFKAQYPLASRGTGWGSTGVGTGQDGPVNSYLSTEYFGLYAVDNTTKKVVYSNIKMKSKTASNEPELIAVDGSNNDITSKYFFSKKYTYFLYYPYKDNVTGTRAIGYNATSDLTAANPADAFLGNVSSGWTVETDQSTDANYRLSDLQVAMQEGSEKDANNKLTISMKHRFGLAIIAMGSKSVPSTRTYNISSVGAFSFAYDAANTTCYAIGKFDGAQPYRVGTSDIDGTSKYYYIVNLVKTTNSYTLKSAYGTKYNTTISNRQWSDITISTSSNAITMGSYRNITVLPNYKNLGILYSYAGTCQTFAPTLTSVKYKMECWGARGASGSGTYYGKGAYTSGVININTTENYYVYVGQEGTATVASDSPRWNGGGAYGGVKSGDGSGGGATDIRLKACSSNSAWYEYPSLCSRIMVAGGGGSNDDVCSASTYSHAGGVTVDCYAHAGGLVGYHSYQSGGSYTDTNQTQGGVVANYETYKGVFGSGNRTATGDVSGGGGGYYGGGGGDRGACGGSSFISGHSGCNAITKEVTAESSITHSGQANHYSGKKFTSTKMIDGAGYNWTTKITGYVQMPNPGSATGTYAQKAGHDGNGYARITCLPYD